MTDDLRPEHGMDSLLKMDLNDEYLLQWKSHNYEIVQEFHSLFKDDRFTDCTIACEDESFRAHRLILSGSSSYFRGLFEKTSCSSPVIVLKDVPAHHAALLLRYMYLGIVSVKREDLSSVLKTANSLRIRGLMTDSLDERAIIMDGATATILPRPPPSSPPLLVAKEGRKGYVPKKLRAASGGDNDSLISSPRASSSEGPVEPEPSGVSPDNGSDSPEGSKGGSLDEEQPWNLSHQAKEGPLGKAKFPILGNYLKNGVAKKMRTGSIDELLETIRMNGNHTHINNNTISSNSERNNSEEVTSSPVMSSQSLAQSWLDQLSLVKEEADKNKENPNNGGTLSLSEAHGLAGIDIAERIRAMTAPFSHTYGNLLANNVVVPSPHNPPPALPNSPAAHNDASSPLPPPRAPELGEIGPNGKPSVTCEVCGKKLADPSSLYRHRKIHSGDKPHKCPFCSRRFIQRYNMKQHMKTHRIDRIDNPELAAAIAAGDYAIPRKAKNI
eukprot:TRINITY_DN3427_c0_g1_i1.p1 TRINITY_DN3427_c0_g1~~TRINITY_DN3427_c0_g1_i1.p1  ORF type:complete len:498 (+),score=161.17 TRINITY_DN3427_c0_g1_i1:135-1628(+)